MNLDLTTGQNLPREAQQPGDAEHQKYTLQRSAQLFCASFLFFAVFSASATTNLYFTHFEPSEGFSRLNELNGQNGWVSDTASTGGNGLVTNFLGTQAAFIGLFPLNPRADYLAIWHPANYQPQLPLVQFTTKMAVLDSVDVTNRDDFYWTAYNSQGQPLLTVDFFNDDLRVYYAIGTNQLIYTGTDFANDTPYDLGITMDFSRNLWSATLNGRTLVTNQPLTRTGDVLDLADMDAIWIPANPNAPGDNFMIFDDYRVAADAAAPVPRAQLATLGRDLNGQFLLRLSGPSGTRYAIEASPNLIQWASLKTNTITDGTFDFIDGGAASLATRFYRARLVP
jgi:hypothetical protein